MRITAFKKGRTTGLAVRQGDGLVDLTIAAPDLPRELAALLATKGGLRRAETAAKRAGKDARLNGRFTYLPPVTNPGKVICVGLNYRDHAAEAGLAIPAYPVLFARFASSFVGHGQPLIRPRASAHFDYEAELVAVIGTRARNVAKARALDHVAGYSIFNEGSIRDFQLRTSQWTIGKNFDRTGAFGPEFVTADELPAGGKGLAIQTRLNGQVLQDSNTRAMIFDVAALVRTASQAMTLEPGDIIVTGTPAGVGFVRKPPIFMKPGDVCEIEIERIGVLSNPVAAEAR